MFVIVLVAAGVVIADRPTDLDIDPGAEFPEGFLNRPSSAVGVRTQFTDIASLARSPLFGVTFLMVVCFAAPVGLLNVTIVEYTTDVGLGRRIGVLALSVIGGMHIAGKFIGGGVSDRMGRPRTIASGGTLMAVGIAVLLLIHSPWAVIVAAVVFGFGWGVWTGLLAPLIADLFGTLSINALFGITTIAFAISNSVAPYLAGVGFDTFGSFAPAFAIAGAIGVAGGGLVLLAVEDTPRH